MNTLKKHKSKQWVKPTDDMSKAINAYLNNETGKFGQYFALPNALVHRRVINDYETGKAELVQSIIAMDLNGNKIGNSSILPMLNAYYSFGQLNLNRSITEVQTRLSSLNTMIPFTVFDEAQLDLRKLNIVEKASEETLNIKVNNPKYKSWEKEKMQKKGIKQFFIEKRHFTGACLFEIEGKYFLFDLDRREIQHKIFNPFLVEINKPVKSIKEAYNALIPTEVKEAMLQGKKVLRQGEWFFIPSDLNPKVDTELNWKKKIVNRSFELRAGDNRPNYASKGNEALGLVTGKVEHSGREHASLLLKSWYKPVANTSMKSWQISGQID